MHGTFTRTVREVIYEDGEAARTHDGRATESTTVEVEGASVVEEVKVEEVKVEETPVGKEETVVEEVKMEEGKVPVEEVKERKRPDDEL